MHFSQSRGVASMHFLLSQCLQESSIDTFFVVAGPPGEQLRCNCCSLGNSCGACFWCRSGGASGGAASILFLRSRSFPGIFFDAFFAVGEPLEEQLKYFFCSRGASWGAASYVSYGCKTSGGAASMHFLRVWGLRGSSLDICFAVLRLRGSRFNAFSAVAGSLGEQLRFVLQSQSLR